MFKKIEIWVLYLTIWLFLGFAIVLSYLIYKIDHPYLKNIRKPVEFVYSIPEKIYHELFLKKETTFAKIPEVDGAIYNFNDFTEIGADLSFKIKMVKNRFESNSISVKKVELGKTVENLTLAIPSDDELIYIHPDHSFIYTRADNAVDDIFFEIKRYDVVDKFFKLTWSLKVPTHHDVNVSKNGYIYAPTSYMDTRNQFTEILGAVRSKYGTATFRDDGFIIVNPNGEVIESHSLLDILKNNNLTHLFLTRILESDPFHINSVYSAEKNYHGTPVKKGDILLSLRHGSLLLIYRPSSQKVIWYKSGPWLNQHDASFNDDGDILVFNNNVISTNDFRVSELDFYFDRKNNSILKYSFKTDMVTELYSNCMGDIATITGGSFSIYENLLFVNFNNHGLTMICDVNTHKKVYIGNIVNNLIDRSTTILSSMEWSHYE